MVTFVRGLLIFLLISLVVGVASCAGYSADKANERAALLYTPIPTATIPPEANPAFIALTMISNEAQAAATKQAYELSREIAQTKEAQAEQARADQATAEARRVESTLQAQYFELTKSASLLTQIADSQRSTRAAEYTATARPIVQTAEAGAIYSNLTEQSGSAEQVALSVRRQEKKNNLDALMPWVLIIAGAVIGALVLMLAMRSRTLKPGEFYLEHKGDTTAVLNPALMASPGMIVTKAGAIQDSREDIDSAWQKDVTRRAQITGMVVNKTLPETRSILSLLAAGSQPPGAPRLINPTPELVDSLDRAEDTIINGDINP